jgi:hypothetical protein
MIKSILYENIEEKWNSDQTKGGFLFFLIKEIILIIFWCDKFFLYNYTFKQIMIYSDFDYL